MDEENTTWFWINYFENEDRTYEYISHKIKSERYERHYNYIVQTQKEFDLYDELEKINKIDTESIKEQSRKTAQSIKQASEYFNLANKANLHVKPLIIYYGMISLSKAVMDSTFKFQIKNRSHGLAYDRSDYTKCQIQPLGFFPRFSACYSGIPANQYDYKNILKLMSNKSWMGIDDLIYPLKKFLPIHPERYPLTIFEIVFGEFEKKFEIHTISCYYLLMYILSMLVRYKPVEWIDMIEGNYEPYPKIDWILPPLLELAITDYPLYILDEFKSHFSMGFQLPFDW